MRVFGFTENGIGIMEIENSLKAEQRFVGGLIEVVGVTEDLDLVCNEEGKFNGMEPMVAWVDGEEILDLIFGNCFICRWTEDGDFDSIRDDDIEKIKEVLKPVMSKVGNNIYINKEY